MFNYSISFKSSISPNASGIPLYSCETGFIMISKVIREEIEKKFGREVRYPVDCESLELSIKECCGEKISASTLKRLFGFIKGKFQPRLYTLDVISKYIGYKNWDDYLDVLSGNNNSASPVIEELKASDLKTGEEVEFGFEPDVRVTLKYIGKTEFNVTSCDNCKLMIGDTLSIPMLSLHHPLRISNHFRGGEKLGTSLVAEISGITFIKRE